jgi:UPF0042 nucleotide-binding protein
MMAMSDSVTPEQRSDVAAPAAAESRRLVLITGMSGAGRSTSLKILEDMGYEAIDNLPLSFLPSMLQAREGIDAPLAVGIDVRTRDFDVPSLIAEIEGLANRDGLHVRLLFLDCDDDILARRYTETRRLHPLARDRRVIDGIVREREYLAPLRIDAHVVLDTSDLRASDLKRILQGHFGIATQGQLQVFVTSFSFRAGLPREADLVFDVRFLDNPFYVPELRYLDGRNQPVGAFIDRDASFEPFWNGLISLLGPLLPHYDREGKSYLTIAVGCTGGRHRSVYVAERLGAWLAGIGQNVVIGHRDLVGAGMPTEPARHLSRRR